MHALSPSVTWAGWPVPLGVSLGIVAVMGLGMLAWRSPSSVRPNKLPNGCSGSID